MFNSAGRALRIVGLVHVLLLAACVNVDPETDLPAPREHQRYFFSEVVKNAKDLEIGMTKLQVFFLLGSAAEESEHGDEWIYLPERIGILIPARALRLEFHNGSLESYGYHLILLGEQL